MIVIPKHNKRTEQYELQILVEIANRNTHVHQSLGRTTEEKSEGIVTYRRHIGSCDGVVSCDRPTVSTHPHRKWNQHKEKISKKGGKKTKRVSIFNKSRQRKLLGKNVGRHIRSGKPGSGISTIHNMGTDKVMFNIYVFPGSGVGVVLESPVWSGFLPFLAVTKTKTG